MKVFKLKRANGRIKNWCRGHARSKRRHGRCAHCGRADKATW